MNEPALLCHGVNVGAEVRIEVGIKVGVVVRGDYDRIRGVNHQSHFRRAAKGIADKAVSFFCSPDLAADAANQLHVCDGDGLLLAVQGCNIGVLHENDNVALCCMLQRLDSTFRPLEVTTDVLRDFLDETGERRLAEQQIFRLLVLADLTEGNSAWAVAHFFLCDTLPSHHCKIAFGALGGLLRVALSDLFEEWHRRLSKDLVELLLFTFIFKLLM